MRLEHSRVTVTGNTLHQRDKAIPSSLLSGLQTCKRRFMTCTFGARGIVETDLRSRDGVCIIAGLAHKLQELTQFVNDAA